jgi:drug/metabolite transporter (DMT)-like permease
MAMFAASAVFSKLASAESMLSLNWIKYYAAVIAILFIYAIAWQQIIKRMPIVTAYANKAVTVIWGIVFGYFVFGESITATKILGAVIIIAGVYLVVSDGSFSE